MRFNINLATQPFEDSRRFLTLWATGLLAVVVLTGVLVLLAVRGWSVEHQSRAQVASERSKLSRLQEQEQQDIAILNRPENHDVREKSQFLNTLIRRKQFSWTQVFSSLEHLMPGRLHVVAITPQLTDDNQIVVRVRVAGDTRDKAIELVRNLEQSKSFHYAQVLSESLVEAQAQGGPSGVQFEITALYTPVAEQPAATQPATEQARARSAQ
ncbi:MAG TPA: hypothetical protein VG892_08700 [Terriglobales bacterium]|jgi:type IV pilus assembly protein PilN|nr:hypothetical protein [Terriglobales bacterium]